MKNEIFQDPIYKQWFAALNSLLKTEWQGKKSELARQSGISKSFMSEISKGDSKPQFEIREKIAQACGKTYLIFLQIGKDILDDHKNDNIYRFDNITKEHQNLVSSFKDKEAGLEANKNLIELEKLNTEEFYATIGRIKGKVKTLKENPAPSKNGTRGGE